MPTTEWADYRFTLKEGCVSESGKDDAPCFLACEPKTRELSIVGDNTGALYIRFHESVRYAEAQGIASLLNDKVKCISYTRF